MRPDAVPHFSVAQRARKRTPAVAAVAKNAGDDALDPSLALSGLEDGVLVRSLTCRIGKGTYAITLAEG